MNNDDLKKIKEWVSLNKMEDADENIYLDRIEKAYKVILPHNKLVLIPYIGKDEIIEYNYSELIALCPITFLPDIYHIKIRYIPNKYIPELKSLKFYFMDYKDIPISHEHLTSKIYNEIIKQIRPKKIYLYIQVNIRGGIKTNIEIGEKI